MAEHIVDDVAEAFAALVAERTPTSIALSGGATARRCYELLGTANVDWGEIDVWFGDERWVPLDDPDSNEGMARVTLLDLVEPRAVHSMRRAGETPEAAAAAYGRRLRDTGPLELVHLGLGPDGHTASLFPGSPSLDEQHHRVVSTGDDLHPHRRITMTLPGLAEARLVVFTVAGAAKRPALERVRGGDDVPAARVRAAEIIWLVDRAAAGAA
jgi:6-phosphogluconolactonase